MACKYPNIRIDLVGEEGNAFAIMGRVQRAMKRGGVPQEEIKAYFNEAQASESYNALLQVTMKWVNCDNVDDEMTEEEADAEWDEYFAECDEKLNKLYY